MRFKMATIKDEIKSLIYNKGYTITSLASEMGITTQSLAVKIRNETLSYKCFRDILKVINTEIHFRDSERLYKI